MSIQFNLTLLHMSFSLQKLDVPDGLKPSDVCKRGWFVNPLGINKPLGIGLMFAAAIPALLAFILMYMETLITGYVV